MDKDTRKVLKTMVEKCRGLLEESISQMLQGHFGIYLEKKAGLTIDPTERMSHLSEEDVTYREQVLVHLEHIKASGFKDPDALSQLIREVAFTHLNRLCAFKMMEARGLIRETVTRGLDSQGFMFYLRDKPADEKLWSGGEKETAYRHYLLWLAESFAEEIRPLFSVNDPANRLYPPHRIIDQVLSLINSIELKDIWIEDETIGWVYQYFTPKELRDKARKESQAPRNSYELAFRNQFYTPRYVVQFLTDNTLGRIWYDMRKGDTVLKDKCEYLVCRPNEVFLAEGVAVPDTEGDLSELSQEDLLRQPYYIAHRPKKDPREIKILDPAAGSGHFMLYCFDLLEEIYVEAYDDPNLGPALKSDFGSVEDLKKAIPGLILGNNLHLIDIDRRATQIAALALWLRSQRAYQAQGLKDSNRPKIKRANIVCAEPMPGEDDLLEEFCSKLEPKLLGQLVKDIFEKMKLAGEAGALIRVDDELKEAIAGARSLWQREFERAKDRSGNELLFSASEMEAARRPSLQETLLFDISGISNEEFWIQAESRTLQALRAYASEAQNGRHFRLGLFADDIEQGFALIDLTRSVFDVVLMNPPYGDTPPLTRAYLKMAYDLGRPDVYMCFVLRAFALLSDVGMLGALTSRTFMTLQFFETMRKQLLRNETGLAILADLGGGVLDAATVETCAWVANKSVPLETRDGSSVFINAVNAQDPAAVLKGTSKSILNQCLKGVVFVRSWNWISALPGLVFSYWLPHSVRRAFVHYPPFDPQYSMDTGLERSKPTIQVAVRQGLIPGDFFRFGRLSWEVPIGTCGSKQKWSWSCKGGEFSKYYAGEDIVLLWENDGAEMKRFAQDHYGGASRTIKNEALFFQPGLTYPRVSSIAFNVRIMPRGFIFTDTGMAVVPKASQHAIGILGLLNSRLADFCATALHPGRKYEIAQISSLPFNEKTVTDSIVGSRATQAIDACREMVSADETSPLFECPLALPSRTGSTSIKQSFEIAEGNLQGLIASIADSQYALNERIYEMYEIPHADQQVIADLLKGFEGHVTPRKILEREEYLKYSQLWPEDVRDSNQVRLACQSRIFAEDTVSYAIGCAFERFDLTFATDPSLLTTHSDPFDALPAVPPGAHSARSGESTYSSCSGVLVDDPGSDDDIVLRFRKVIQTIWNDSIEDIEEFLCQILQVRDIRQYFQSQKIGSFWIDHLKRYSKLHRKAPLYWPLQSRQNTYNVWVYYHGFNSDSMYKILVNHVEPKIRLEKGRLDQMHSLLFANDPTASGTRKIGKDLERQENIIADLEDFKDRIGRIANLSLVPDLDDGVLLNAAPLWDLIPWSEPKKYWDALLAGEYEWSSISKQLRAKGLVHETKTV